MGCEWERAKEELTSLQKSDSSYVIVTRFRVWLGSARPSGILVDGDVAVAISYVAIANAHSYLNASQKNRPPWRQPVICIIVRTCLDHSTFRKDLGHRRFGFVHHHVGEGETEDIGVGVSCNGAQGDRLVVV